MRVSFHGRRTELDALSHELALARSSGLARLVALQGRRQVGKSTLVEHFAERSGVAYAAMTGIKDSSESLEVDRALLAIAESRHPLPGTSLLHQATPMSTWSMLFPFLQYAVGDEPAVIILDEFPWMLESSPGLDGLLKALLDSNLKTRPILIVLVGSDESMMENLFEHDRPLFAKADRRLVVEPFNPAESAALLSGRSAWDVFDFQLVTGGFPGLLEQASSHPTAADFVRAAFGERHAWLVDAAQIRLAGELTESANAEKVLRSIGANEIGEARFSEIAGELGGGSAAQTAVTRAITTLVETKRIVALDLPVGDRRSRLTRYRIADTYLRFWFRFVEPHLRSLEVGRCDIAIRNFETSWSTWRGKAIEPIVRHGFELLCAQLDDPYPAIERVGGWWDRTNSNEFDLVGLDHERGVVAIGSINWRPNRPFDESELRDLSRGRSVIPGADAARLVAVCPAGVQEPASLNLILDADDLLEAWR